MEYLNLDLRVTRQPDDRYEVAIIKSPAGEHYATVDLPLSDAEFNESCRRLSLRRDAAHPLDNESVSNELSTPDDSTDDGPGKEDVAVSRGLGYGEASAPDLSPADVAASIGRHLFESIFSGEMLSCYRRACDAASDENKGLRLRLRLNSPELATIPWEFLFDQYSAEYVSLSRATPVSRYLEIADRNRSLTVKPPLRILGVVASPTDLPTLNVDREKENMEQSVHHLLEEGLIELTWLEDQSIRGLHAAVASENWHVLHFVGHGGFDENAEEGFLALSGPDGTCDRLHATELANLLSGPDAIRLAVLNCCEGARGSDSKLYSSVGAILTKRKIPAVVSMQYEITDAAAIEFARAVYDQIASGSPIDAAIQEARIAISATCRDTVEWGTPVLHMRSSDGELFDVSFRDAIYGESKPHLERKHGRTGRINNAAEARSRELNILMSRVGEYWVRDDDTNPLRSQLVPLEMEFMPDAVTHPIRQEMDDFSIAELFNDGGGSILILGDPGSGKTTTLVGVAAELIERADRDEATAVPVIVPLSSWSGEPMLDWLIKQIRVRYLIPENDVRRWLESHHLVLLLDGLDEVAEDMREACVDAINEVSPEVGFGGIGVTCRTREYVELDHRLQLTAAVRIKNISDAAVREHVSGWGADYEGLAGLLRHDSSMRILARSPLMLGLMCEVYRGVSTDEVVDVVSSDAKSRRRELMDAYVEQMFDRVRDER